MISIIQSGRFSEWSPSSLSSLAIWFDASDESSLTESGGAVSAWASQVGAVTLSQTSAGAKPTTGVATVNGLNVLSFDGGDVLQSASPVDLSAVTGVTFWAVCAVTTSGDRVIAEHSSNYNSNTGFICYRTSSSTVAWGHSLSPTLITSTATLNATTKLIIATSDRTLATNETTIEIDGDSSAARSPNSNTTGNFSSHTLFVGARSGVVAAMTGTISEVGLCTNVLSAPDQSRLRDYIRTKWGTS